MKKLVLIACVALSAFVSQAAAIAWNSGTIYIDGTKVGKDAVTAILWESTSASAFTGLTGEDLYAAYKDGTTGSLVAGATVKTGSSTALGAANLTTGTAYDSGVNVYAALLYVDVATGNYIANFAEATAGAAKVTIADLTKYEGGSLGGTASGAAISGWTAAVPEPTSGLLMLVGLGALALRRRRA